MYAAWAEETLPCVMDLKAGVLVNVCFFQASFGGAQPYVRAFPEKKQKYWVQGHIHALEHYGGLPSIIAPCTCGGARMPRYFQPLDGTAYAGFSIYYGIPIVPDKPDSSAHAGGIDIFEAVHRVLYELRNKLFYSFDELNACIDLILVKPVFQPHNGMSLPVRCLPRHRYEIIDIVSRVVGENCHIKFCGVYYSVSYRFCKQRVTLHESESAIIIYGVNGQLLASHKRCEGGQKYVTDPSHMPPHTAFFSGQIFDGNKYIQWAENIGDNTLSVIEILLVTQKYEQQAFKTCMAILQLSKKHGCCRLETACKNAKLLGCISFSAIHKLLVSGVEISTPLPKDPHADACVQLRLEMQ